VKDETVREGSKLKPIFPSSGGTNRNRGPSAEPKERESKDCCLNDGIMYLPDVCGLSHSLIFLFPN
jgi:hypothetical protein